MQTLKRINERKITEIIGKPWFKSEVFEDKRITKMISFLSIEER